MSQEEVFNFLKKNRNRWFTVRQVAERLKVSYGSICSNLARLRLSEQVKFKNNKTSSKSPGRVGKFVYMHK